MVVPPLKVDIYRRIIECALDLCVTPGDESTTQLAMQSCLANLSRICATFEEICTPQLYQDCMVRDVTQFLEGNPRLMSAIKTFRVSHAPHSSPATYYDLLSSRARWEDIGRARSIDPVISPALVDVRAREYTGFQIAAQLIQDRADLYGPGALESITRVCMTKTGNPDWGYHLERADVQNYDRMAYPWLPSVLLDLPSVEHYCQTSMLGPLALYSHFHKPAHPPKIVTFHSLPPFGLWDHAKTPPVVFGSINRYMTPKSTHFVSFLSGSNEQLDLLRAAQPLFKMLDLKNVVNVSFSGNMKTRPCEGCPEIGSTVIELYNFFTPNPCSSFSRAADGQWSASTPASDLARQQELLDTLLGPWKGKVFLKSKEDCPPCSACGHTYS